MLEQIAINTSRTNPDKKSVMRRKDWSLMFADAENIKKLASLFQQ